MSESSNTFSRILRGSAFIFLGNTLGMAFEFFSRIVPARHLTPETYGLLVLGLTFIKMSMVLTVFGLPKGIARQIPRSGNRSYHLATALVVSIPASLVLSVVLVVSSESISETLGEPTFTPVLSIFAASLPFLVVIRLAVGALRGTEDAPARVVVQNFGEQGLKFLALFCGVIVGANVVELSAAVLIATMGGTILTVAVLRTRTELLSVNLFGQVTVMRTKQLLRFSLPLMISGTLWLLVQQLDNLLIGIFLPSQNVGWYDSAFTLGRSVLLFSWTFGFMILPVFSELHLKKESDKLDNLYKLVTKWTVFLTLPLLLALGFVPEFFLALVFGDEYTVAGGTLSVLLLGFTVHIIAGLNQIALIATGYQRLILRSNLGAFLINIILNIILIPVFGIIGAALASVSSYLMFNSFLSFRLFQLEDIQPIYRPLVFPVCISTLIFTLAYYLLNVATLSHVSLTLFFVVFGFLHLFIIVVFDGIERQDIDAVLEIIN